MACTPCLVLVLVLVLRSLVLGSLVLRSLVLLRFLVPLLSP
ncbi:hypothetical protein [Streptomyces maremycinicus]|nr:hypothetical protein [Streptomyces sp. NBRC 110468]